MSTRYADTPSPTSYVDADDVSLILQSGLAQDATRRSIFDRRWSSGRVESGGDLGHGGRQLGVVTTRKRRADETGAREVITIVAKAVSSDRFLGSLLTLRWGNRIRPLGPAKVCSVTWEGRRAGDSRPRRHSQAVKDFGHQMVADHGKANQQLAQLAKAANLPQPSDLDEEHKAIRSQLEQSSGPDFDLAYMRGQVADHQKTAQLFEWEIGSGQDPQLKAFASQVLPVVLRHLQMASNIELQLSAIASGPPPPVGAPSPGRPPGR